MADTDDWGGVPVNNQPATPTQGDDWGGVPVSAPKLPDTTGIQQTAQSNLQSDSDNTQPQSFNAQMDKGMNMPVSAALKGGDQNTPLPPDIRGHLVDSYKNGTSQDAGDFMQSALPAVAKTVSSGNQPDYTDIIQQAFIRGFKSNLEAVKQTGQAIGGQTPENSPEQNDNIQPYLTAPYKMGFPDFKKIIGKTVYGLTESSPEIGGAVAGGMAGVAAAGGPEDPAALVTGPLGSGIAAAGVHAVKSLAPTYAAQLKANNGDQEKAWSDTKKLVSIGSAGTGASMALFGYNPFESAVKNTLFQVFGVQPAVGATQQAATNVATGKPLTEGVVQAAFESGAGAAVPLVAHKALSGLISTGYEDLKPMIAEATGKPVESITPQDIDQVISTAFKDKAPHAQDFTNVATVLEGGENIDAHTDTLHNIYKETGVAPDQVYSDAQENPQIASDIADGKVPSAYDHLRSLSEDTGIEKGESVSGEIPEGEQENPAVPNEGLEQPKEKSPVLNDKAFSDKLYNDLHVKLGQDQATDIVSMQRELQAKETLGKELDEKFYLKKEDPNHPLTEDEQKLYDEHIQPLHEQERELYQQIIKAGYKGIDLPDDGHGYVHRIVKGKGHYLDKYDSEFGSENDVGFGKKGISQTTGGLKDAQFYALEDGNGKRELQMGAIPEGYKVGDNYVDEAGNDWTVKRAKTEEIEKNTDLKYYKSAVGNTEDNIRRLEKTLRNIEFLDDLKSDVQKSGLGIGPETYEHPANYQQVNIPQLRGWSFDPRVAEVLNDIYDRGGNGMLEDINNFLIKGMFLNPVPHIENVVYDHLVSRGLSNLRPDKGLNYINQGIKDVAEFSPEYIDVLKHGGALRLPAVWKKGFYDGMQRQFFKEAQSSKEGLELAKSWGFDTVPAMADAVFNTTQKALWGSGDALLMAKIRELKDQGMTTPEAIKEAQKHLVDYRIPPRVGEQVLGPQLSRKLSKALQGNPIVVFTRYHYGLFKSLGHTVMDAATAIPEKDPKKFAQAAAQLFSAYFMYSVVDPAIANAVGSLTGKKEKFRSPGIVGLVGAIADVAKGKKTVGDALRSQFIVSPGLQLGADILQNKVIDPSAGHVGVQAADYAMKQGTMAIPSIPYNVRKGKSTIGEEALKQVGITPDKEYKPRKASKKTKAKFASEEANLLGNDN